MKVKTCPECNQYVVITKYNIYRDSAGGHIRCKNCGKEIHVSNSDIE